MTQHQSYQKSNPKTSKKRNQQKIRDLPGESEKNIPQFHEDVTCGSLDSDIRENIVNFTNIDENKQSSNNKVNICEQVEKEEEEGKIIHKPADKINSNIATSTTTNIDTNTPLSYSSNIGEKKEIHPFVYWAQSATHITLRVDLLQAKELKVEIVDNGKQLIFSATGKGAHGLKDYYFTINFYLEVDEKFVCQTIERYVLLFIKKSKQPCRWPRLIKEQTKLAWLRFDFDRYTGDDDSEDDTNGNDNDNSDDEELNKGRQSYELLKQQLKEAKDIRQQEEQQDKRGESYNSKSSEQQVLEDKYWSSHVDNIFKNNIENNSNFDIFNPFNKKYNRKFEENTENQQQEKDSTSLTSGTNKNLGKMKYDYRKDTVSFDNGKNSARQLDYKKTYLFLYNLMMFIMFLKVYIVLIIKLSNNTMDDEILQGAAFIIRMLTYTQLLETLHPILGLVPGGPLMPFTQVIGRIIVNYFLTDTAIRLDSAPYGHYLFIVWSTIEIFRYPYYALRVFKVNVYPIAWCRYTLFIPLYPLGGLFESMVIFSTINQYEKTGEYSISLPNQANISFNIAIFLKIYTYFILGPTIYSLMKYMWKQRSKQLKEKED